MTDPGPLACESEPMTERTAYQQGRVVGVHRDERHRFSKLSRDEITLLAGLGVEGDAHAGRTVQHRSRVARTPEQPNLRQVHLLHEELLTDLLSAGHDVGPGDLGENVTTHGVDLLGLPTGAVLSIGPDVRLEVTGLRNPCRQIESFQPGLLALVAPRDDGGHLVRLTGVMAVVLEGGVVRPGDEITVAVPAGQPRPLLPV